LGDLDVVRVLVFDRIFKCRMTVCEHYLFGAMAVYVGYGMNSGA
jgi:hypothetical protein